MDDHSDDTVDNSDISGFLFCSSLENCHLLNICRKSFCHFVLMVLWSFSSAGALMSIKSGGKIQEFVLLFSIFDEGKIFDEEWGGKRERGMVVLTLYVCLYSVE